MANRILNPFLIQPMLPRPPEVSPPAVLSAENEGGEKWSVEPLYRALPLEPSPSLFEVLRLPSQIASTPGNPERARKIRDKVRLAPGVRQTVKAPRAARWNSIVLRTGFTARWLPAGEAARYAWSSCDFRPKAGRSNIQHPAYTPSGASSVSIRTIMLLWNRSTAPSGQNAWMLTDL
jgi:hypothetical protein